MELVFALVTYLGIDKVDTSYFRSIDDCMYFAERINKNAPVPNLEQSTRFTAICKPQKVNLKRTKVY